MRMFRAFPFLATVIFMAVLPLSAQETAEKKAPEKAEKVAGAEEIKLIETKPFHYCAVEMTGSYEQHPNAFMALYGGAGQQGLPMDQIPFGVYWNSPEETPEEELKWEIGFAVPDDAEIAAPLVKKQWEYTHHVTARFTGTYDSPELQALYVRIFEWAQKNGYEPAGPCMEKFLDSPVPDESGEFSGTVEVFFPVVKKE